MILDFLVSLGIFFSGSVLIDGFTFLSNISDYSGYVTGCFNDIINYFSGFFRGTPPVEVDVIINGENILENGNLENSNLMYGNENLMLENQDTINLIYGNENLMLENQDTINLIVETVNLTLENQDTVNLTVENQDTVNLTVENQDTVNLTVENQDTENSVIRSLKVELLSGLIRIGGCVYNTKGDLLYYACEFDGNLSHYRHSRHSKDGFIPLDFLTRSLDGISEKQLSLPDICSFKGFPEELTNKIMGLLYNDNEDPLSSVFRFGKGNFSPVKDLFFTGVENFEFTFTDKNTVKYLKENLDIFYAYTDLPFRLGMLLEFAESNRVRIRSVGIENMENMEFLDDVEEHCSIFHTVDICTLLYQSIEKIPEVSIRNFGDLYKNDKDFKSLFDFLNDKEFVRDLLTDNESFHHRYISLQAEVLNSILDKLYKKNNTDTEISSLINTDTEISSLINKGGKVYDNSPNLLLHYNLLNGDVDNIPSSIISSFNNSYSNLSHIRHSDTSILSEESINLKVAEFNDKPAKCVRLPDFCSFKGFSEKKFQTVMKGIYKNEQPLLNTLNRCGYGTLENYLFDEDENFEFTFNDENTVKYVMENLDIFKAYTHLPFRLGMLHELSELAQYRLESGNLRDLKGHVAMCHTLDVCTALSKSIYEIPEVSSRNFIDLYKNDSNFKWQVDIVNNRDTMTCLLKEVGSPLQRSNISFEAEVLNCLLDKLYKKNNGTDNN